MGGNEDGGRPDVKALEAFVASVQHLPLFSGTAIQLIRSIDDEDVTVGQLARLISTDPALVAHLLRIVNSPYFAPGRRIGTVSEACTVLGLDRIRRTVIVAVLQRPLFAYLHDTAVARAFWKHELVCASLARHLGLRAGVDGELSYLAGLLHDIGRLVMLMRFPDQGDLLLRHDEVDDDTLATELDQFGFTHAQVGAALLELWGLPDGTVRAADQHVDETEPEDAMAAAVWRANLISHEFGDQAELDEDLPWMAAIGLDARARTAMFEEIEALASAS